MKSKIKNTMQTVKSSVIQNVKDSMAPARKIASRLISHQQQVEPDYVKSGSFKAHKSILEKSTNAGKYKITSAKRKEINATIQTAIKKELEAKQEFTTTMDAAFVDYLKAQDPISHELITHIEKYKSAKYTVDNKFDELYGKDNDNSSQLNRQLNGAKFRQLINEMRNEMLTTKDSSKKNDIQNLLSHCSFLDGYAHDPLSIEIDKHKQEFASTNNAKDIINKFKQDTTPIYATIMTARRQKHVFFDSTRAQIESLQYAGATDKQMQDMPKLPNHHHIANKYMLFPFEVVNTAVAAATQISSKRRGFWRAKHINKSASFASAAQQAHVLCWQHECAISRQTLVSMEHGDMLIEELQAKFKHNPYVSNASTDDELSKAKADLLSKQHGRIELITAQTTQAITGLESKKQEIKSLLAGVNNDSSIPKLKKSRKIDDHTTAIAKLDYLIAEQKQKLAAVKNEIDAVNKSYIVEYSAQDGSTYFDVGISELNTAIAQQQKFEIKELVAKLYGNNNSANFKLLLKSYLDNIDVMQMAAIRNVSNTDENGEKNKFTLRQKFTNQNVLAKKRIHGASNYFDTKIEKAKAKKSAVSKVKQAALHTVNAPSKLAVGIVDIVHKSLTSTPQMINYGKDAAINTGTSIKWGAAEAARHVGGIDAPFKVIAKTADKMHIPGLRNIANPFYALDHTVQRKHTSKLKFNQYRNKVKLNQRDRRSERVASELMSKLDLSYDMDAKYGNDDDNKAKLFSAKVDKFTDDFKQATRHISQTTGISGIAKERLLIDPMYANTSSKWMSKTLRKILHVAASNEERMAAVKSYMQSAHPQYVNDKNGNIDFNDTDILQAWHTIAMNTDAQARFTAKSILSLYIPLKLASNYVGVALYQATQNPIILFINVPGNPIDDIMVFGTALITSLFACVASKIADKNFDKNKHKIVSEISNSIYENSVNDHSSKNANNTVDHVLAMSSKMATLGRGGADIPDYIELESGDKIQTKHIDNWKDLLAELKNQLNLDSLDDEQKANLTELIELVGNLDINTIMQNARASNKNNAAPESQKENSATAQNFSHAVNSLPTIGDIINKKSDEVKYQSVPAVQNVGFGDQVSSMVKKDLGTLISQGMDETMPVLAAVPALAVTGATGLVSSILPYGGKGVSFMTKLKDKYDKHAQRHQRKYDLLNKPLSS
jgi:hypothetical protein